MASLVGLDLCPHSSLYKQIANALNRGEIVPEDIIFGLLSKRRFLYLQQEILDQHAEIGLVVNFKCTEDFVVKNQEEQGARRLFPEKEKKFLSFKLTVHLQRLARTSVCLASTTYQCCPFFTRTDNKMPLF